MWRLVWRGPWLIFMSLADGRRFSDTGVLLGQGFPNSDVGGGNGVRQLRWSVRAFFLSVHWVRGGARVVTDLRLQILSGGRVTILRLGFPCPAFLFDCLVMTASSPPLPDAVLAGSSKPKPDWLLQAGVWLVAYLAMYVPLYMHLAETTWASDQQSHGPMIILVCAWLLWTDRAGVFEQPKRPALVSGGVVLTLSLLAFVLGRSQGVIELDALSQIGVLVAGLLLIQGHSALRKAWFPLLFLLFSVPLPGAWVQAATMPLKHAVSVVAEELLFWAGYPVGRSGVTLTKTPTFC